MNLRMYHTPRPSTDEEAIISIVDLIAESPGEWYQIHEVVNWYRNWGMEENDYIKLFLLLKETGHVNVDDLGGAMMISLKKDIALKLRQYESYADFKRQEDIAKAAEDERRRIAEQKAREFEDLDRRSKEAGIRSAEESLRLSKEANDHASRANQLSAEANVYASTANDRSIWANRISLFALLVAAIAVLISLFK